MKVFLIMVFLPSLYSCTNKEIYRLPQDSFKNFSGVEINVSDVKARKYYGSRIKSLYPCNDCYFLEFFFKLKNIGKETISFNTDSFSVIDEFQNKYLPSVDANTRLALMGEKDLIGMIQIHPQIEKAVVLAFEVPKNLPMTYFAIVGKINGFQVYFPGGAKYVESDNQVKHNYIQKIVNPAGQFKIGDLP